MSTERITHLVAGAPWTGVSERTSKVYNPATGAVTGELDLASAATVDEVVKVAQEASKAWAQTSLTKRAQVLFATPSYALHIGHAMDAHGLGPEDLALEVGVFGGEAWTPAMGAAIERALGLTAVNMYGLSEVIGPGVAVQCREERAGSHINEDHFLAEVVDPQTGEPLPDGAEGELVFSTLTKEALPLLRYRTGDIAAIDSAPCPCGRTLAAMSPVR